MPSSRISLWAAQKTLGKGRRIDEIKTVRPLPRNRNFGCPFLSPLFSNWSLLKDHFSPPQLCYFVKGYLCEIRATSLREIWILEYLRLWTSTILLPKSLIGRPVRHVTQIHSRGLRRVRALSSASRNGDFWRGQSVIITWLTWAISMKGKLLPL